MAVAYKKTILGESIMDIGNTIGIIAALFGFVLIILAIRGVGLRIVLGIAEYLGYDMEKEKIEFDRVHDDGHCRF